MNHLVDQWQRPLKNLRLSVTDRCNLRCQYCMPEENYRWLPKDEILRYEEMERLVSIFSQWGVHRLRITGGEPLLRRDLARFVQMLSRHSAIDELTLTTNGTLLEQHAKALKEAGLSRLTISLDSLDPQTYRQLSQRGRLEDVIKGIERAQEVGFRSTKLNAVVIKGVNDQEMGDLLEFANKRELELRFIEYMDVGGATQWDHSQVMNRQQILQWISSRFGRAQVYGQKDSAPATRYILPRGQVFGIISSTTQPFCSSCDRSRITADGFWYLCLYAQKGIDLKSLLRSGYSNEEIAQQIARVWSSRRDRGAEERLNQERRAPFMSADALQTDPHLEMHTRGG